MPRTVSYTIIITAAGLKNNFFISQAPAINGKANTIIALSATAINTNKPIISTPP